MSVLLVHVVVPGNVRWGEVRSLQWACNNNELGLVLGYSRFVGGAARAQVEKVSLFYDFIRGRPKVCF